MKLLADENMDAGIVEWLRSAGCDVLSVMELMRGATDDEVLVRANAEGRIILTKDKRSASGVILLRLHAAATEARLSIVQSHWPEITKHSAGNFVVVTRDRLRIRPITPANP